MMNPRGQPNLRTFAYAKRDEVDASRIGITGQVGYIL